MYSLYLPSAPMAHLTAEENRLIDYLHWRTYGDAYGKRLGPSGLARKSGLSYTVVNNHLRGELPTESSRREYAKAFDMTLATFDKAWMEWKRPAGFKRHVWAPRGVNKGGRRGDANAVTKAGELLKVKNDMANRLLFQALDNSAVLRVLKQLAKGGAVPASGRFTFDDDDETLDKLVEKFLQDAKAVNLPPTEYYFELLERAGKLKPHTPKTRMVIRESILPPKEAEARRGIESERNQSPPEKPRPSSENRRS